MTEPLGSNTESKKLQTPDYILKAKGSAFMPNEIAALQNDARIAHEQREVIQLLVDALLAEMAGDRPTHAYSAIACARPFLEDYTPNAETIAAMEESRSGNLKSVATVEELMADLNSESED